MTEVERTCHYCGDPATTRDHVVPRRRVLPLAQFLIQNRQLTERDYVRLRQANVVDACSPCNNAKGDRRAVCCDEHKQLWRQLGPGNWAQLPTWPEHAPDPAPPPLSATIAERGLPWAQRWTEPAEVPSE